MRFDNIAQCREQVGIMESPTKAEARQPQIAEAKTIGRPHQGNKWSSSQQRSGYDLDPKTLPAWSPSVGEPACQEHTHESRQIRIEHR